MEFEWQARQQHHQSRSAAGGNESDGVAQVAREVLGSWHRGRARGLGRAGEKRVPAPAAFVSKRGRGVPAHAAFKGSTAPLGRASKPPRPPATPSSQS
jgi:hypothetical protein